jgi:hypothetical protein
MADRKISDLTALTTPASGDYLPIVDISEAAAASKNKRITIEELMRGAPDGTAAAPSIAFESDTNTGIYSPGADQLAISTNGTGRLFVDSSGNVGIGTTSPATNLHVSKGAAGETVRFMGDSANVRYLSFTSSDAGIFTGAQWNRNINSSGGIHTWSINSTERVRLDSSGRLLVGTSSDSGGALLQVNGNRIRIATANTPASAGATGTTGEIAWDADYIYVCTATNTWKRTAIATW